MTSAELYPPEDVPALLAARNRKDTPGATRTVRGLRHHRKDGSIIAVEMTVRPFKFEGVPALLAMAQDVTERELAERARLAAEEQLRQSQKMEAVGQLTSGIAHDFNNLLMVILSNTDELLEEEKPDPALTTRLELIAATALRAAELTKQLLAFSRKQVLSPKVTNLSDLVTDTGKLLQRALGAQIEIEAVLSDDLWMVNIDRTQLETALVNLAINARDAMPGGGKLLIETRNVTWGAYNRPAEMEAGDYAMVAVTDTGIGMSEETQAKAFDPFFTTKELGKGTGLGLSMVYGFVKQSKGHITIDSAVGRGTTFNIFLPRHHGTQAVAAPTKPSLPRGKERVLVVEDEPQVRASVVAQLQSLGYIVSEAAEGAAGLAACETASEPFDLLLTDVMMPGQLTGGALANRVADRWPTTKIAFMSGFPADDFVKNGVLDTDVHLLVKPFRKNDLAHFMRRVLDGPFTFSKFG